MELRQIDYQKFTHQQAKKLGISELEYLALLESILSKDGIPSIYFLDNQGLKLYSKQVEQIHHAKFTARTSIFKYLIPSNRREEVMGDLIETNIEMIEEGFPMWKIKVVLYFHGISVILALFKTRLQDYGTTKKKINKNH